MDDYKVRWGETFDFLVEVSDDSGAVSATLWIAEDTDTYPIITKTDVFTDNVADLSVPADEMEINLGDYHYEFAITYDDGRVAKFPSCNSDCDDCDDTCELPTLTVCDSLENGNSS